MDLPLRTFWSLNAQIVRLRAEDRVSMIELFLLGGMGASEASVTALREYFNKQLGETTQVTRRTIINPEQHKDGIQKLRNLKARMDGKVITGDGAASA